MIRDLRPAPRARCNLSVGWPKKATRPLHVYTLGQFKINIQTIDNKAYVASAFGHPREIDMLHDAKGSVNRDHVYGVAAAA